MDDNLNVGGVDGLDSQGIHNIVSAKSVEIHEQLKEVTPNRRLSFAKMKLLRRRIRKLRREDLTGMVEILKEYDPVRFRSNDEIWFDINELDTDLVLQLWRYVEACKRPRIVQRVKSNIFIGKGGHEIINLSEKAPSEKIFIDLTEDVLDNPRSKTGEKKRRLQTIIL
ncbi:hypothetical protein AXG93_2752s1990 [Marchantia polymorpha subsp. ruderalis]|uniref:NET domain-containing protein n=2 Tax=Marchantia polymorpha TaxID=3197 RepID=A0A176VUT5_MARPO|nr:hypothetical protein AXG93_2752s1990 [Marchantia polymorpha subsp. ruderalis]